MPEEYRVEIGAQVYGCDICQDACPWNRGVEKRRADEGPPPEAEPVVSLRAWLEVADDELRNRYDRLYFPRNDPRYLRRNALVAAGNSGDSALLDAVRRYAGNGDPLLREHAEWALGRLEEDDAGEA
jgi:epoxyqueuosine reductase